MHTNFAASWVCFYCLWLCSTGTRGRGKHLVLSPSYSLHSQTSSERLNHVPSSRVPCRRGSRFVVRAEAVSYSFVFLLCLCYCLKNVFHSDMDLYIQMTGFLFRTWCLNSQEMLVNLKSRAVSISYLVAHAVNVFTWFLFDLLIIGWC